MNNLYIGILGAVQAVLNLWLQLALESQFLSKVVIEWVTHMTALVNDDKPGSPGLVVKQQYIKHITQESCLLKEGRQLPPSVEGNSCNGLQKRSMELQDPSFISAAFQRSSFPSMHGGLQKQGSDLWDLPSISPYWEFLSLLGMVRNSCWKSWKGS